MPSPLHLHRVLFIVAAGAAASLGVAVRPAPPRVAAFVPAVAAAPASAATQQDDPTVVRARYVTIDFDAFSRTGSADAAQALVPLELFPDRAVIAVFDRFDPNDGGVTWVGHLQNSLFSNVTLVYRDGFMTGSVNTGLETFSIRPASEAVRQANPRASGELHVIAEVDQSQFPREAPPIEVAPSPGELAMAADDPMRDTADAIDLLVVYTATARANIGGTTIINNLINLGVSETNTAYANSGVSQRLRLVHTAEVAYAEVSSFSTNLNAVRNGTGALSGVPALREAHRADLVMMLVDPPAPDACGIAFLMGSVTTAFAPNGYSVADTGCISPNYTFGHELGHNMGARHDWYVDNGLTPFSYAHGYVNPTLGQRWRTVMAYPDHCQDLGVNCTRLLQWANPLKKRNSFCGAGQPTNGVNCSLLQFWYSPGTPMGVPQGTGTSCVAGRIGNPNCDADDARTLNNTALTVANLRQVTTSAEQR